jgi:carboxyl-terminal processing protease
MRRAMLGLVVFLAALAMAGLAWMAGFATAVVVAPVVPAAPSEVAPPGNFALFSEAWSVVRREFYGEHPQARQIADGAVQGLIEALDDEAAAYVPAAEAAGGEAAAFRPRYLPGLGLWVAAVADGAQVLAVAPGSPAEEATKPGEDGAEGTEPAILPGDRLLAAGETPLALLTPQELVEALTVDEAVTLVVQQADGPPFGVELTPDPAGRAPEPLTISRPEPGVVVLRPAELAAENLAALDAALAELAGESPSALVLDLRDNPGGDRDTARRLAGRFLEGDAWVEVDADGSEAPVAADRSGAPPLPAARRLVVLVNAGTSGTAEMLAGALADAAGARLIGEATRGTADLAAVEVLPDGGLLRLTTGTWRLPSGQSVAEGGLKPDETVSGAEAQLAAAVAAALRASAHGG